MNLQKLVFVSLISISASIGPGLTQTPPKRVLMLTTSADHFPDGHPTGLWLEEFAVPYLALRKAGVDVSVVSAKGGSVPIDPRSQPTPEEAAAWREASDVLRHTAALSDTVQAADYDAIFVPGGHGCMVDLAVNPTAHALIGDFARQNKVVAAICHGPVALLGATLADGTPLLKGKRVAVFTDEEEVAAGMEKVIAFSPQQRLAALGATVVPGEKFASNVVQDGLLITGQNPASSAAAVKAMLDILQVPGSKATGQ